MNVCCLGIGLAVALYYSPALAGVALGTVPLMAVGGMVQMAMMSGSGEQGGATGKVIPGVYARVYNPMCNPIPCPNPRFVSRV
jgi:hypothetical protein